MSGPKPRVLLAEGKEELLVLPELLKLAGMAPWNGPDGHVIHIEQYDGVSQLLARGAIEAQLAASGLRALGILADANGDLAGRWQAIRNRLLPRVPGIPESLPPEGLVYEASEILRVGVWLMPDNVGKGMLETVLLRIRRGTNEALATHVQDSLVRAREIGAPVKEVHKDKAELHTWLAWQDPPGLQMHTAVKAGFLRSDDPAVLPFVKWVRRLYNL